MRCEGAENPPCRRCIQNGEFASLSDKYFGGTDEFCPTLLCRGRLRMFETSCVCCKAPAPLCLTM